MLYLLLGYLVLVVLILRFFHVAVSSDCEPMYVDDTQYFGEDVR